MTNRLRWAVDEATLALSEAGVASARADAEELAAYAVGTSRGRLPLIDSIGDEIFTRYRDLVATRAKRVPLQHIVGTVKFGPVTLEVGPGVFTPRPETEALFEWAVAQDLPPQPLVVDLCTGSGALAVALAHQIPSAQVIGVDNSPDALAYARRNAAGMPVELRHADVAAPDLFDDLDACVDLVVANPPYLPDGTEVEREVAEHDPPQALFGGPDGMALMAAIAQLAGRWLVDGGLLAVEHDETLQAAVTALLRRDGRFAEVAGHDDLTGRPRFVTARRMMSP